MFQLLLKLPYSLRETHNTFPYTGTKLITPSASAYSTLRDLGWDHQNEDSDDEDSNIMEMEATWAHLKRWVNANGGGRPARLSIAIEEYQFHRNNLQKRNLKFWKMLVAIGRHGMEVMVEIQNGKYN